MKPLAALTLLAVALAPTARAEPARPPATAAEAASRQAAAPAAENGVTVSATALVTYRAAEPAAVQAGNAEAPLQVVAKLLRDYRAAYGANPVGNNVEIARALRGNNPRAMRFADDNSLPLSPRGEILDRWEHPLYFHPISATVMEVRSAGPDGKMWTADDLVAR